jgi:hypothetical protein
MYRNIEYRSGVQRLCVEKISVLVLIIRGWINPRAIMRLEGLGKLKKM